MKKMRLKMRQRMRREMIPQWTQGYRQLIECVNTLLQEQTNWKKGMFEQILANHSTLLAGLSLVQPKIKRVEPKCE